jgi:hypothetical protein
MHAYLAGYVERYLLQRVLVRHAIDKGQHDIESGTECRVVLPQPFHNPGMLLWHDVDGLDDEYHRYDKQNQADTAETKIHLVLRSY